MEWWFEVSSGKSMLFILVVAVVAVDAAAVIEVELGTEVFAVIASWHFSSLLLILLHMASDDDDAPVAAATPVAIVPAAAMNNAAPGLPGRMFSDHCRRPAAATAAQEDVPRPDRRADDATD